MTAIWAALQALLRRRRPEPDTARDRMAQRLLSVYLGTSARLVEVHAEPWRRLADEVAEIVILDREPLEDCLVSTRAELRARNRAYGRASATIGVQRGTIARLTTSRRLAEQNVDALRAEVERVAAQHDAASEDLAAAEESAVDARSTLDRVRALAEVDWLKVADQNEVAEPEDSAGHQQHRLARGVRDCADELRQVLDGEHGDQTADPADTAQVGDQLGEAWYHAQREAGWCEWNTGDQYPCYRQTGHAGQHVETDSAGEVSRVWPQDAHDTSGSPSDLNPARIVAAGEFRTGSTGEPLYMPSDLNGGRIVRNAERWGEELDNDTRQRAIDTATTTIGLHYAQWDGFDGIRCICGWHDRNHAAHVAEQLHATGALHDNSAARALARLGGAIAARLRAGDIWIRLRDVDALLRGDLTVDDRPAVTDAIANQLPRGSVVQVIGEITPLLAAGIYWIDIDGAACELEPGDQCRVLHVAVPAEQPAASTQ